MSNTTQDTELPHIKNTRALFRWCYDHGVLKGEFPQSANLKKDILDISEKKLAWFSAQQRTETVMTNHNNTPPYSRIEPDNGIGSDIPGESELENRLTNELKHTLKLVPSSQRETFVFELARWYEKDAAAQYAAGERAGREATALEMLTLIGDDECYGPKLYKPTRNELRAELRAKVANFLESHKEGEI